MIPLRVGAVGLLLAAALALFLVFFHVEVLDPKNVHWLLHGDLGAHVVGWHALRNDDWRWPLGLTHLLDWPNGASVVYTDSNPLLSLLLKPFGAWLPSELQFIGPWFLACLMLHVGLGYLLLRRHLGYWRALAGAVLLAALPTLYNRIGHDTLFAHWTILWALWIYFEAAPGWRRAAWFAAAMTVTVLIHGYLAVMVAAIWASDLLRSLVTALMRRAGPAAVARVLAQAAPAPIVAFLAFAAVGGLGDYLPEGGFGIFSMGLDALFNPAFFNALLPTVPQDPGQTFEGFQYLGAGLLLLVSGALIALAVSPRARKAVPHWPATLWLAPALAALTLLALSNVIQVYDREVLRLPYDRLMFGLTDAIRGSARLFWPVAYVLVLTAIRVVGQAPAPAGLSALCLILGLQAVDLRDFVTAMRAATAPAAGPPPAPLSPVWNELIGASSLVEIEPPDPHVDQDLFYRIAWRAASLHRPVSAMYTARSRRSQRAWQTAARADFVQGRLRPERLYVMLDRCVPGPLRGRARVADGVLVIPPAAARSALPAAPAPKPNLTLGQRLVVGGAGPFDGCLLTHGWSAREPWGVWSEGPSAGLELRLGKPPQGPVALTITASGFPPQGQTVAVGTTRRPLARFRFEGDAFKPYRVVLSPDDFADDGSVQIVLDIDRPTSPYAIGLSSERRELGVALQTLSLDPANSTPEQPPGPPG